MKRHEALQPLSRDHYRALQLARSLVRSPTRADAGALATRAREVRSQFERDLEPHFQVEERWLFPALGARGAPELAERAIEDHRRLRALVAGDWSGATAAELGRLLEQHVRFEERVLFPRAEELLEPDELARIHAESAAPAAPAALAASAESTRARPRVVIVGGGFGGLAATRALRRADVDVVLIDRRNFHLFQPLLYQVATGGLSPANIATPFRWALRRQANVDVVLGEVTGFDVAGRQVRLGDERIAYDHLVLAAGATHSYFGQDWEDVAPGLKTIEDATEIRSRVLLAFERADRATDANERTALLTFVIVGAGPTGVELAGALAEISQHTLRHDFGHVDPADARILLVEAGPRVLAAFPEDLSDAARRSLQKLGIHVLEHTKVEAVRAGEVELRSQEGQEIVPCATVLWAAGVQASPLGRAVAEATGASVDRSGRLAVEPDLTLPGHPEISVIGDLASFAHGRERPLPGVAPVAMQQGRYVARRLRHVLAGRTARPFEYRDRGTLATIGRAQAVVDLRGLRFSGFFAWLLWLFVHVMNLAQAESRVLVFIQWTWSYLTYDRSARLITKRPDQPDG